MAKTISYNNQDYEFPDNMDDGQIDAAMRSQFPNAGAAQQPQSGFVNAFKDMATTTGNAIIGGAKTVSKFNQSAKVGFEGVPTTGVALAEQATDVSHKILDPVLQAVLPQDIADKVVFGGGGFEKTRKQFEAKMASDRPDTTGMSDFQAAFTNFPESAVQSGVALATAAIGGPLSFATRAAAIGGLQQDAQSYSEAKDAGLSTGDSVIHGIKQGGLETFFEMLPTHMLVKDVANNAGFGKILRHQLLTEIPGEVATQQFQDLNDWTDLHPEGTVQDFINGNPDLQISSRLSSLMQTLGTTIGQTGAMAGGGHVVGKALNTLQNKAKVTLPSAPAFLSPQEQGLQVLQDKISQINAQRDQSANNEVNAQAEESALKNTGITDAIYHNIDNTPTTTAKVIPLFQNEAGDYVNTPIEGKTAQILPLKGEGVKLLEGDIKSNVDNGEISFAPELAQELKTQKFSQPEEALKLAAMMQMKGEGLTTVHQVNEFGQSQSLNLSNLDFQNLNSQFQSLKSDSGRTIDATVRTASESPFDNSVPGAQLTKDEELAYRMMNPSNAEEQLQTQEKLKRMESNTNLAPHPGAGAVDQLDAIWQNERNKGTFETPEDLALENQSLTAQAADAGGITDTVYANRGERYQAEILPPADRPIQLSTVPETEGLSLRQVAKMPGTYAIGNNLESFPVEYQKAVLKIAEDVRQKFMSPDTRMIINFENLKKRNTAFGETIKDAMGNPQRTAMGAHFQLSDGSHVITPRELASWDKHKLAYNPLTVNESLYSLNHEIGHAVWINEFFRDVDNETAGFFRSAFARDDRADIAKHLELLPEPQRKVVEEWLALRDQVGTQSAKWFLENWVGVRKLGLGVGKTTNKNYQSIYAWGERELAKTGKRLEGATAKELISAMGGATYILNFNEYMAEQFSRYAFENHTVETSLKDNTFFQRALQALRSFFESLKTQSGEKAINIVKAGQSFSDWVNGLSELYQRAREAKITDDFAENSRFPDLATANIEEIQIHATSTPESHQLMSEERVQSIMKMVPLVRMADVYSGKALQDALEFGQYEEAEQIIRETLGSNLSFDKTYTSTLLEKLPNKKSFSAQFLSEFAKQPGIKANDKNIVQSLIETSNNGMVEKSLIKEAVQAASLPISVEYSNEYQGQGFKNININADVSAFTGVFRAPQAEIASMFSKHFTKVKNYLGHFRGFVENDKMNIIEVQSDVFQRLNSSRTDGLKAANAVMKEVNSDAVSALSMIQKNWENRFLREINAEAKAQNIETVRIAHENLMGKVEGWIKGYSYEQMKAIASLPQELTHFSDKQFEGKTDPTLFAESGGEPVTMTGNFKYADGEGELLTQVFIGESKDPQWMHVGSLRDFANNNNYNSNFNAIALKTLDGLKNYLQTHDYAQGEQLKVPQVNPTTGETTYNDMTGIYKRHREMREFAQKAFGANEVVDKFGQHWFEYSISPEMESVISFDATTPEGEAQLKTVETMKGFKNKLVNKSQNFISRALLSITQLQQLAADNPQSKPLLMMNSMTGDYTQMKSRLLFRPQGITQEWIKLSGKNSVLLETILRREQESGEHQAQIIKDKGVYAFVDSLELNQWLAKNNVDTTTDAGKQIKNLYLKIKNSYQYQFNTMEAVLRDITWKKFGRDTRVFTEKWRDYQKLFDRMIAKPFMPNMQFGNYVVYVKDKVVDENGNVKTETVFRRHFESREERDALFKTMLANKKESSKVLTKNITEDQNITMAIPYDFLQNVADSGAFTQENINLLQELLIPSRVDKFEKYWNKYNDQAVDGSASVFRNFIAYTLHNSNFVAKLRYTQEFQRAIISQRSVISAMEKEENDTRVPNVEGKDKQKQILTAMLGVKQYLMHPPQEYQGVRAAVSLLYLNYMLKTAVMNLSTVLHTILAAHVEYGIVDGSKAFSNSFALLKNVWGNTNEEGVVHFASLENKIKSAKGKTQSYWTNIKYAMDKAVQDGVIDQSFAYFMAGMASSGTRMKMYQKHPNFRHVHSVIDAGMIPFRNIEKVNRITSLLTFYQLEMQKGETPENAYEKSIKRTNILQGDYTAANRPSLLRGGTSVITLFASYSQMMGYLFTGGYDRLINKEGEVTGQSPVSGIGFTPRLWLAYAMLGGISGLPFFGNIMDILTQLWRRFFGTASPEFELQKFIQANLGHSQLVMHGMLHATPTPFGSVDLSSSLGLGRLIPGTEPIRTMDTMKPIDFIGNEVTSATGVMGSFAQSLVEFSQTKDASKLPGAIGKVAKAIDIYEHGIVDKNGVRLYRDPDTGEFEKNSTASALLQAGGFVRSELSDSRKLKSLEMEVAQYYANQQQMLMHDRNLAIVQHDVVQVGLANEAIRKYNSKMPSEFNKLKITGKTMSESLRSFRNHGRNIENNHITGKPGAVHRAVNLLAESDAP